MSASVITQTLGLLDHLSQRDRAAVLAALIAVIFGLDMWVVMPIHDQRITIEKALTVTQQAAQQAKVDATLQQQATTAALQQRRIKVTQDLASFGLNNTLKDSLTFLLSRTLQGHEATVLSLQATEVEQVALDLSATQAAATPGQAVPTTAQQATALYRHQYELRLQTDLPSLPAILNALERDSKPLRVERVLLRALPSGLMEMTVTLVTIGLEKTWLAL